MKILISANKFHIRLFLPLCFVTNFAAAAVIHRTLNRNAISIGIWKIYRFLKTIKRDLKKYKGLKVFELKSHDGTEVSAEL